MTTQTQQSIEPRYTKELILELIEKATVARLEYKSNPMNCTYNAMNATQLALDYAQRKYSRAAISKATHSQETL